MNKAPKTIQDVAAAYMQKAREDRIDAAVRKVFQNSYSRMGRYLRYCTDHNAKYTPGRAFAIRLTIEGNAADVRRAFREQSA